MLGPRFVRGLSLVTASGGHSSSRCRDRSSSRCVGLSLSQPLPPRGTGSRRAGSAVVAHGPSCSVACGILPDQGSNPCPPHQQADSQPLRHQGSPSTHILMAYCLNLLGLNSVSAKAPASTQGVFLGVHKRCLHVLKNTFSVLCSFSRAQRHSVICFLL